MNRQTLLNKFNQVDWRDRQFILAHVLGISREQLLAHPSETVPLWLSIKYLLQISRRARHTPLAYLLGEQPFYGLNFKVNKHTLIPRPETEWLVDEALNILREHTEIYTVIDVGTGSGAIAIALAKNAPDIQILATDISAKALKVAQANAAKHNAHITFIHNDGVSLVPTNITTTPTLIIANLPYIPEADYVKLTPDVQSEPRQALVAGSDGLDHYRTLLNQIEKWPHPPRLLFECDPSNAEKLARLVQVKLPTYTAEIANDHQGLTRYVFSK